MENKKIELTDIKKCLPAFKDFNLYKAYGVSENLGIEGRNIIKPYKFHAKCFIYDKYFEYSEIGYAEAIKWLEEKRLLMLTKLGVKVEE